MACHKPLELQVTALQLKSFLTFKVDAIAVPLSLLSLLLINIVDGFKTGLNPPQPFHIPTCEGIQIDFKILYKCVF